MITAGIDVGTRYTSVLILNDGKIAGKSRGLSGGIHRRDAVSALWKSALESAGIAEWKAGRITATGIGACDAAFADNEATEPLADARAARFCSKDAACVVDIGADQTRVVTLGDGGAVREVALNQKCAAGMGLFLEYMAGRLGLPLDEASALEPGDPKIAVHDGCCVFAELGALELLFDGVPPKDIYRAVIAALAYRMNGVLNDKLRPAADATLLIGGVSKHTAMVSALRKRSGIRFIIPENAEYGTALGAALLAAER